MEVFRLSRKKYSSALSGRGASIMGARWNSPGVEIIYTASNRSLAMAELAVHLTLAALPDDFMMLTIFIPDNTSIKVIHEKVLPAGWNSFPHQASTRIYGDSFIKENKYCLLKVPSAVTRGDFNILLNPYHSEFKNIKILSAEAFPFDKRIFE
ncbi:MAG: RES family NAD+ phosphorylase [Ignavibacteriaceae bacterium]